MHPMHTKLALVAIFIASHVNAAKFPSGITQCYAKDVDCLRETINSIIRSYPLGFPGLNIPSLDPLFINTIEISQGDQSPIAIHLKLSHLVLHGISKGHAVRAEGFDDDPEKTNVYVQARMPDLTLRGNYTINGRVLVLPIQGDGEATITLGDCDLKFRMKPQVYKKNNRDYIKTESFKFDFLPAKFGLHFTNLFNGDKALGDNMNRFLNENSNDILAELKPNISLALEQIFEIILNRIFSKLPYNDLLKH